PTRPRRPTGDRGRDRGGSGRPVRDERAGGVETPAGARTGRSGQQGAGRPATPGAPGGRGARPDDRVGRPPSPGRRGAVRPTRPGARRPDRHPATPTERKGTATMINTDPTGTRTSSPGATIEADPEVPRIIITREFAATVEQLIRAHLDPDRYARWSGPEQLTTTIDHWDARTGGSWAFTQTDGEGTYSFHGCFHEVGADR